MKLNAEIFGVIEETRDQEFCFYLAGDYYYYNGNRFRGSTKIEWDYLGPYFGTGFDATVWYSFKIFFDIGVVLTSAPAKMRLYIPQEQLYI